MTIGKNWFQESMTEVFFAMLKPFQQIRYQYMCTDKICNHAQLWGHPINSNLRHHLPYMSGPEVWGFWAGKEQTVLSQEGVRVLGFIPDEISRLVRNRIQSMKLELIVPNHTLSAKFCLTLWNLYHKSNSACLELYRECWHSQQSSYLPGTKVNRDHEGGSFRVRPFHCTSVGLTPTIAPNVGNSSA